jgi:hypothetical protein
LTRARRRRPNAAESSYAYALNNPVALIDPSGLGAVWIRDRLRWVKDSFYGSSSAVIPLTFAIAGAVLSPVILGYWLLGYLLACTSFRSKLGGSIIGFAKMRRTSQELWAGRHSSARVFAA